MHKIQSYQEPQEIDFFAYKHRLSIGVSVYKMKPDNIHFYNIFFFQKKYFICMAEIIPVMQINDLYTQVHFDSSINIHFRLRYGCG